MRAIMLLLAASHLACSNAAPEGSVAPQASGSVADDTATAQLTAAPPTTTTTGSAAPSPKPEPVATAGASIALQPAVGSVNRGASIALKLVNEGSVAHSFEVPQASNSCGRFRWSLAIVDAAGQRYQADWDNLLGPCGSVFIPAHRETLAPGDIASFDIDTARPWYLTPPPRDGISGSDGTEPPKQPLAPGRYVVEVRGGDVIARASLTIAP